MTKDKKVEFLTKLEKMLNDYGSKGIQLSIGDSIYNHRVVSVNQAIRFLKFHNKTLSRRLSVAFAILKPTMSYNRKNRGSRTDAYDLNELRKTLMAFVAAEQVAKAVEYSI
jgi:hypothetical protein